MSLRNLRTRHKTLLERTPELENSLLRGHSFVLDHILQGHKSADEVLHNRRPE